MLRLPPDQMMRHAWNAYRSGQMQVAEQAIRSVVKVQPRSAEAWALLGRIVAEGFRFEEADEAFDRAEKIRPGLVNAVMGRASLMWRKGNDEAVLREARKVLKVESSNAEARVLAAASLRRLGRYDEALAEARQAPMSAPVASLIGSIHLDQGENEKAIEVVSPLTTDSTVPATHRVELFHVLGQAQENLGRYDEAVKSYLRSKQSVPTNFAEGAFKEGVKLLKEIFTREFLASAPRASFRTERPVFVAGMPRSGTTLLDRIIASHPRGGGAGETRALRGQIAEWMTPDPEASWPRIARRLTTADLDRVARRYVQETSQYAPSADRIADKHLQNWVYVGLMAMAFPEARVIHIRRDPVDCGISCLERLHPQSIHWAVDLRTIGVAWKGTEELMRHWKEVTSMRILTVDYEELIRDHDAQTRRIIDFLGLPWDDACLNHHSARLKGHKPPPTLASEQAAKPIYDKSIGRGARFGAALDPLREELARPL